MQFLNSRVTRFTYNINLWETIIYFLLYETFVTTKGKQALLEISLEMSESYFLFVKPLTNTLESSLLREKKRIFF